MSTIDRAIRQARLRLMACDLFRWLAVCLVAAAGLVIVAHLFGEAVVLDVPRWVYAALGGAAVVVAGGVTVARRWTDAAVAARIDDRLRLKDRVGSALYARKIDHPYAGHIVADAERAVAGLPTREAVPFGGRGRAARWWYAVPVAVAAAVAVVLYVHDPFGSRERQAAALAERAAQQQREVAIERARHEAVERLRQVDIDRADVGEAEKQAFQGALATLSDTDVTSPEGKRKALEALGELRENAEQRRAVEEEAFRPVQNMLSGLDDVSDGPAEDFADALRRGDFEAAEQALAELNRQIESGEMDPDDRDRLRKQLDQLADQLDAMSAEAEANRRAAESAADQALANAGVDPATRDRLRSQGFPPDAVDRAIKDAATPPTPTPPQTQPQPQPHQQSRPPQTQPQDSGSQQQSNPATQPSPQQQQQPGGQQHQNRSSPQQTRQQVKQSSQQAKDGQSSGQCANKLSDAMRQMSDSLNPQQQGNGSQNPQGNPSPQQGGDPARNAGSPGSSQGFSQGAGRAQQQLSDLAERQRAADQARRDQQALNDAMQRIGNGGGQQPPGAQPPQPPSNSGVGQQAGRSPGGNPFGQRNVADGAAIERVVDPNNPRGRVIAERLVDGGAYAGEPTVEFSEVVRTGRDAAEKAVTDDSVPKTYHRSIREYFGEEQ